MADNESTPDRLLSAISSLVLLRDLPKNEIDRLLPYLSLVSVADGKVIASANTSSKAIFFIVQGSAKVSQPSTAGKEATIALLGTGAHIGVVSLLTGTTRTTEVVASCKGTLLAIDGCTFLECLRELPTLTYRLLVSISERLNQTTKHLAEDALYELDKRLVLRLLEMAEVIEFNGCERLLVRQRPSHRELANMLGVSREAVTRSLSHVERQGHITVIDNQLLVCSTPS